MLLFTQKETSDDTRKHRFLAINVYYYAFICVHYSSSLFAQMTTPTPLWRRLQEAAARAEDGESDMGHLGYAAVIREIRDRMPLGCDPQETDGHKIYMWLYEEARRAEAEE